MKRFTLASTLFTLPFILILAGSANAQVAISGQITDAITGEPLSGFIVSVENEWNEALAPPVRAETDEEGRYVLRGLAPGAYRLKAEFQQEVRGRTLVFALPTRVFNVGSAPVEVDFAYTPLAETSPAFRYVAENADEGINPDVVVQLGRAWLASSRAFDASGEIISIDGGYFDIQ